MRICRRFLQVVFVHFVQFDAVSGAVIFSLRCPKSEVGIIL